MVKVAELRRNAVGSAVHLHSAITPVTIWVSSGRQTQYFKIAGGKDTDEVFGWGVSQLLFNVACWLWSGDLGVCSAQPGTTGCGILNRKEESPSEPADIAGCGVCVLF